MDEKRNALFTVGILVSIILIFTLVDFFHGSRVYSETENRVLASKPKFSAQELFFGSFSSDYEKYVTDQFVSRDKWIYIKTLTDIALQKKVVNGVYLAADNYLIEQHLPQDYREEQVEKKLALLEPLAQEWDAKVMLVPTADNILFDKLPSNAIYYDETALLEQVLSLVGEEQYVDVYTELKSHSGENIYYRTDHHWTSLGAYYGYLAWAKAFGKRHYNYDSAELATASGEFLGTLQSKVNMPVKPDAIQYFSETEKQSVLVTYDFERRTDTLYEASYLDIKNKYGFFLDDNHAFVEIETSSDNGKTLFVLKDSYANCFVPLLTPHYEKIYMLDLRYYNGRLFDLMEQYKPEEGMDVLVIYNCIHFLEDFMYF